MNVDHLLQQTCTISVAGAQDRFGKKGFSDGVDYACRFQQTSRIMRKPNGEKAPIVGIIWLASTALVNIDDKLEFLGDPYRVMMISPMIDGTGATRHLELMVSNWSLA